MDHEFFMNNNLWIINGQLMAIRVKKENMYYSY